jgi:RHS repeat-associated protein
MPSETLSGHIALDTCARVSRQERIIRVMLMSNYEASEGNGRLASMQAGWPEESVPRNPQASYYRARYYDSSTGRFISEDPLRLGGGKNFYPYANNTPTSLVDPLGTNSTVSVGPNGITINLAITIYGPGATPERAAAWQKNITDTWNNNPGYGGCTVNFNVQVTPDPSAKHWFTAGSNPNFPAWPKIMSMFHLACQRTLR